jgi:lipopolysaccharide/colanic/teichoic acid biosynthesis glycosyltransferase
MYSRSPTEHCLGHRRALAHKALHAVNPPEAVVHGIMREQVPVDNKPSKTYGFLSRRGSMPQYKLQYKNVALRSGMELCVGAGSATGKAWEARSFYPAAQLLLWHDEALSFPRALGDSQAISGSDWAKASLAIHTLPTNCLPYSILKRAMDIFLVFALSPILLPLMSVVAVIVRLSSPGPILYSQRRLGRFGLEFRIWKFRSMYVNGDEILREHLKLNPEAAHEWNHCQKLKNDPRITRLGAFLRRSSLDELPQFINVLLGSMSLVGPRPIVEAEIVKYEDAYFFYTSAKPGLSGLWQISGRSDLSYTQRIEFDKEYVRSWSLALDLKILWRTAWVVWRAHGAV